MGEERMFEDLLRRTHLDLAGLAGKLLRLFSAPKIERAFDVTIAAGQTSVTAPHGLGRQLLHATITPKSAVSAYWFATWDATNLTITLSSAAVADVVFGAAVY